MLQYFLKFKGKAGQTKTEKKKNKINHEYWKTLYAFILRGLSNELFWQVKTVSKWYITIKKILSRKKVEKHGIFTSCHNAHHRYCQKLYVLFYVDYWNNFSGKSKLFQNNMSPLNKYYQEKSGKTWHFYIPS